MFLIAATTRKGLSVEELKVKAKEDRAKELQKQKEEFDQKKAERKPASQAAATDASSKADAFTSGARKDSSPVKVRSVPTSFLSAVLSYRHPPSLSPHSSTFLDCWRHPTPPNK